MISARPFFSFFPQFTPDPLNDAAWGPGFTDWDLICNLPAAARPPFVPARGMYDPADDEFLPELERALAAMSPDAGLVLYHYFFDGRHVLPGFERQLLAQQSRVPFFICWANESWSKRWVGLPNDIIIEQRHDVDAGIIADHVGYIVRLFELEGYQRYQGRPLLLIYNPQASPTLSRSIALYREAFTAVGHNPFIGACLSYPQPESHMAPFDFGCEFEPRFFFNSSNRAGVVRLGARVKAAFPKLFEWIGAKRDSFRQQSGQRGFHYSDYVAKVASGGIEQQLRASVGTRPLMRSTFLSWNNTPRYRHRSTTVSHLGVTAAQIFKTISALRSDDGLPLFVNSWNEWSEGAALEAAESNHPLRQAFLTALGLKV